MGRELGSTRWVGPRRHCRGGDSLGLHVLEGRLGKRQLLSSPLDQGRWSLSPIIHKKKALFQKAEGRARPDGKQIQGTSKALRSDVIIEGQTAMKDEKRCSTWRWTVCSDARRKGRGGTMRAAQSRSECYTSSAAALKAATRLPWRDRNPEGGTEPCRSTRSERNQDTSPTGLA